MPEIIQQVHRLRQQAAKAVAALEKEIAKQEQTLAALKAEAARWRSLVGGQVTGASAAAVPRQARKPMRRLVDWSAVLAGLPRTFTAREVAQKTGKPMKQVYVRVGRWMKDKKVRKGRDGYQKVSALIPSRS